MPRGVLVNSRSGRVVTHGHKSPPDPLQPPRHPSPLASPLWPHPCCLTSAPSLHWEPTSRSVLSLDEAHMASRLSWAWSAVPTAFVPPSHWSSPFSAPPHPHLAQTSHQQGCCCHGTRAGPFSMGGEGAGVPRGAGSRAPEGEAEAPRPLPDFHCGQAQLGVNSLRVVRAGLQGTMTEPRSRTFQIKRRRIGLGSPGMSEPKAIPSESRALSSVSRG